MFGLIPTVLATELWEEVKSLILDMRTSQVSLDNWAFSLWNWGQEEVMPRTSITNSSDSKFCTAPDPVPVYCYETTHRHLSNTSQSKEPRKTPLADFPHFIMKLFF